MERCSCKTRKKDNEIFIKGRKFWQKIPVWFSPYPLGLTFKRLVAVVSVNRSKGYAKVMYTIPPKTINTQKDNEISAYSRTQLLFLIWCIWKRPVITEYYLVTFRYAYLCLEYICFNLTWHILSHNLVKSRSHETRCKYASVDLKCIRHIDIDAG